MNECRMASLANLRIDCASEQQQIATAGPYILFYLKLVRYVKALVYIGNKKLGLNIKLN